MEWISKKERNASINLKDIFSIRFKQDSPFEVIANVAGEEHVIISQKDRKKFQACYEEFILLLRKIIDGA